MSMPQKHRGRIFKARMAFIAAILCLGIYILACVLSPPAWSPDSSRIAILVTPPGEDLGQFALFTYDIGAETHFLLDEVRADGVLSAPSWSPDGRWIAYYKIEQPANDLAASESESAARNTSPAVPTAEGVAKLFSEEDLMPFPFLWEILEQRFGDQQDAETFEVKLILISPDGRNRKVLSVMEWIGDAEMREALVYMRPAWFPDSKRLLYARGFDDHFYVGSIELATGRTCAHLPSSVPISALSPDGQWVASYMEDRDLLMVARTDGSLGKCAPLDFAVEEEQLWLSDAMHWSDDCTKLFVPGEDTALYSIDLGTGTTTQWITPDPCSADAYYLQPPNRNALYCLTYHDDENAAEEQVVTLRRIDVKGRTTSRLLEFRLPEISSEGPDAVFSIAPDGRTVLARYIVDSELGEGKTVLAFYHADGKKLVETDRWLLKPLYNQTDVTFDERLLGEWRQEETRISITGNARQGNYRLTWREDDRRVEAAANLIRLKDAEFLALFMDETILQRESPADLQFRPDTFLMVVALEPKLILKQVEYDELNRALNDAGDSIQPEGFEDAHMIELERVQ